MPSTTSSSVSSDFASSMVMTPSLPTFCIALAIISPTSRSPLAEMTPTWAISALVETFFERFFTSSMTASTARSMPRFRSIGFIPAATALEPSRTIAWASTVAVVVPSPARSLLREATSLTICAPMFSNLSESSISLATVTPSLVIRGAPNDLSSTTLRPFGPKVTLTAWARMSIPCSIRSRASVPSRMSLAAMIVSFSARDDAHDVGFLHDDQLVAVELDLGPGPFAEQHPVAGLDVERLDFAIVAPHARPDGDNLAFHRFFLGGIGDDDPAFGLRLFLHALDHHAIVQGSKFHEKPPRLVVRS